MYVRNQKIPNWTLPVIRVVCLYSYLRAYERASQIWSVPSTRDFQSFLTPSDPSTGIGCGPWPARYIISTPPNDCRHTYIHPPHARAFEVPRLSSLSNRHRLAVYNGAFHRVPQVSHNLGFPNIEDNQNRLPCSPGPRLAFKRDHLSVIN